MKITLYFINWNDAFYLPFIKKHYGQFCQRIVMYDNYSTDESRFLASFLGFQVREFGIPGKLDDHEYVKVKNNCWKEERRKGIDYVIVCDADEFVVIPEKLTASAPVVEGFNMISEDLPKEDIFEITTGAPSVNYSKQAIFNPDRISEINFVHGCHRNNKVGDITTEEPGCKLFHFRQIGGVDRQIERHSEYRKRLSAFNLRYKMGSHYGRPEWTSEEIASFNHSKVLEWNQLKSESNYVSKSF